VYKPQGDIRPELVASARALPSLSITKVAKRINRLKRKLIKYSSNQIKQVANQDYQARNHSNIYKVSYNLTQPLTLTSEGLLNQSRRREVERNMLPVNLYNIYDKYLIKHNNNKLNFIIN